MEQKKSIRSEWQNKLADLRYAPHWGKAAEKLRGMEPYRTAKTVFATPHDSLHQARINCLADGKNLLMPAPSIRDGFYLLAKRSIPFKEIPWATTYKGLEQHGLLLKSDNISELPVGLLLTDSLAVDTTGGRIDDGNGFFDLCCAILYELDGLEHNADIVTFIREEQISRKFLPQDKWDVKMTRAVTPQRILHFEPSDQKPQIFWDKLPQDRIKRIDPLWKLYRKAQG